SSFPATDCHTVTQSAQVIHNGDLLTIVRLCFSSSDSPATADGVAQRRSVLGSDPTARCVLPVVLPPPLLHLFLLCEYNYGDLGIHRLPFVPCQRRRLALRERQYSLSLSLFS